MIFRILLCSTVRTYNLETKLYTATALDKARLPKGHI